MELYFNLTSPYARMVRIALKEKGLWDRVVPQVVDPWSDDLALMKANPLVRVPALVTDEGEAITESLVILLYLESEHPQPALIPDSNRAAVLAQAGVAIGVLDAAVHTLVGRIIAGEAFDGGRVGLRRRRGMEDGLVRLETNTPVYSDGSPSLATIATIVAIDYLNFRFPAVSWLSKRPRLRDLRERLGDRLSFRDTLPRM